MSTSASFTLIDKHEPVITMYSHWDGYPEGIPLKVMKWLSEIKVVDALTLDNENVANGVSCLAAQLIAKFKTGAGSIYLYNPEMQYQLGEYYIYDIFIDDGHVKVSAYKFDSDYDMIDMFEGSVQEFIQKFGQ